MNCLYCYRNISTDFNETTFDCRWHSNWDVKFCWYNPINSAIHKEGQNTLYQISLLSTDEKYLICLHLLSNTTQFRKRDNPSDQYKKIVTFPKLEYITPENASSWMDRILNLRVFL